MSKLSIKYLMWTFAISLLFLGFCIVCSINGILLENNALLYIPYILGGLSPTIASFIVLKQSGKVNNFADWLRGIFDFKHKPAIYLLIVVLSIVYILPQCLISGYEQGAPWYFIFLLLPQMVIGGGMEEAGWRHILQPEVEKKFNFTASTIFVGVIWWVWHLPLFFIEGVWQYGKSFWIFGIGIIGMSFILAAIKKKTNSTWLCVLLHSLGNAWVGIYIFNISILGVAVSTALLILISYIWLGVGHARTLKE